MKIGVSSGNFHTLPVWGVNFEEARSYGFEAIDYQDICSVEGLLTRTEEEHIARMKEEKARADAAGVEIYQVHGPWPTDDKTEESRARMLAAMKRGIFCASLLGASCYVIHPLMPCGWGEDDAPLARELTKNVLIELSEVAKPCGITVCLENMPFTAHKLSTVEETAALVREIDRENVAVCLDTGHANFFGTKGGDMVRLCGDKLACLHVHDNPGYADFHAIPFTRGNIDWRGFRDALKEIGYKAPLVLETNIRDDMPEKGRRLALSLMYETAIAIDYERN